MTTPLAAQLEAAQLPVHSAQGLDVSNFQGRFNWAATQGLTFGIHRLTQGLSTPGTNSPDPTAVWNHNEIAKRGLHRGAYHFLDPRESGAGQAARFVAAYHDLGLTPHDMLWLDNENASNPGPAATAACARAFMAELDKLAPHNPRGVYTFISYAQEGYCNGLGHYPLWLAHPAATAPVPPPPWAKWIFWQWGTRNGADADAFNGTAGALDDWIASFAPPHPHGPFRHVADGTKTGNQIAAERNTTWEHIAGVTARAMVEHAGEKFAGAYWTSKP